MKTLRKKEGIGKVWQFLGGNLFETAKSQAIFYKKIKKLQISDTIIQRYKKFLALMIQNTHDNRATFLVPTLVIDFVWHQHLRMVVSYNKDTSYAKFGIIDHDDSIADTDLRMQYRITSLIWKEKYGEDYIPSKKSINYGVACGGGMGNCALMYYGFYSFAYASCSSFGGGGCAGGCAGGCGSGGGCGGF